MKQRVSPAVAVIVCIVVLALVGFVSSKVFAPNTGDSTQIKVPKPDPNDPHFKPDPKLSGGS